MGSSRLNLTSVSRSGVRAARFGRTDRLVEHVDRALHAVGVAWQADPPTSCLTKRCSNSTTALRSGLSPAASNSPITSALSARSWKTACSPSISRRKVPEEMKPRRISIKADTGRKLASGVTGSPNPWPCLQEYSMKRSPIFRTLPDPINNRRRRKSTAPVW